jgi:hypothetical protein
LGGCGGAVGEVRGRSRAVKKFCVYSIEQPGVLFLIKLSGEKPTAGFYVVEIGVGEEVGIGLAGTPLDVMQIIDAAAGFEGRVAEDSVKDHFVGNPGALPIIAVPGMVAQELVNVLGSREGNAPPSGAGAGLVAEGNGLVKSMGKTRGNQGFARF